MFSAFLMFFDVFLYVPNWVDLDIEGSVTKLQPIHIYIFTHFMIQNQFSEEALSVKMQN